MDVSLVIPQQREFFEITTESGGKKKIPFAKQKNTSNLLVAKFKLQNLPQSLQDVLTTQYSFDRLSSLPVYKLPSSAFIGELLALPLSDDFKLIGVHGFVYVQSNTLVEGSQTTTVVYKRNEIIKKRFILCEILGEIIALHERGVK